MPYTTIGKHNMIVALGATHVAAFDGDPTAGGTELDRVAISFAAPSGGAREQSANPQFAIQAGEAVNHVGYFDAGAGGNMVMYDPVPEEVFTNAGIYTLTSSAHNLNS